MYKVNFAHVAIAQVAVDGGKAHLWHRRMGHANEQYVKKACSLVTGIDSVSNSIGKCVVCAKGKQTRCSFKSIGTRAKNILDLVHSDVCGPMSQTSHGGANYFVLFVDDFSRKTFLYTMKSKSEVKDKFVEFKNRVERETGRKIRTLRSDNGGEYIGNQMKSHLRECGIRHQTSAPYTPEQNGLAERMNRTIVEKARCMLFDSNLSIGFWAEAVSTAAYIVNRLPCSNEANVTPEEAWTGRKPDVKAFRIFGSKAMVHIPKQCRKKLDSKSKECIFVGYSEDSKAYRLYDPANRSIVTSRDVVFFETEISTNVEPTTTTIVKKRHSRSKVTPKNNGHGNYEFTNENNYDSFCYNFDDETEDVETVNSDEEDGELIDNEQNEFDLTNEIQEPIVNDENRGERNDDSFHDAEHGTAAPQNLAISISDDSVALNETDETQASIDDSKDLDYVPSSESDETDGHRSASFVALTVRVNAVGEPNTVREALAGSDAKHWKSAMQSEYRSLLENGTWELIDPPADRKPIDNKWVFKKKRDSNGVVARYKARLVVKGYAQKHGIDYEETYAPVVRHTSIRFLLAIAAKFDLNIHQMDAVTAFLQGTLDECILMNQPECFHDGSSKVCRLKKSIYGLKQASRVWNSKLNEALTELGLVRSNADPCIYYSMENNRMAIIAVYVDDILLLSNDNNYIARLKSSLSSKFKMKDMGEASSILGINIERDRNRGTISIDQSLYIKSILERFGMSDCNPVSSPLDLNQKLSMESSPKCQDEIDRMSRVPYQEAIGSIMYAAQLTRPDICFAVSMLSRFNHNPSMAHWNAVKRVLRYMKGTVDAKLVFDRDGNPGIIGYCDADWANDLDLRRSTTGYMFLFHGAAISWSAKRQQTVALSTTEAEYMSLSSATQEAVWLKTLNDELLPSAQIQIFCDNKSAICLASNNMFHKRTKHISIRYHFVREKVADGSIKINYVATNDMIADVLTKSIPSEKAKNLSMKFGLKFT